MTNQEMREHLVRSLADLIIHGDWKELAERAITLEVIDQVAAAEAGREKHEKAQLGN